MKQFILTPAGGKRLIGKALASHPLVLKALESKTIVIVAGTTNGYAAEEILTRIGQAGGFSRKHFFRGVTMPPSNSVTDMGRLPDESGFPCGRRGRGFLNCISYVLKYLFLLAEARLPLMLGV